MKYKDQKIIERLHKKAREMILNRGIKGWNMGTLAAEAGIAKSTLYRIIDSKEELILGIIIENMQRIEVDLKKILLDDENEDLIEKVSALASENVPLLFGTYLNEALLEYPELEDKVKENEENIQQAVLMFLKHGQTRGQIKMNIDLLTVFELIMGTILQFVRIGYSGDELSRKLNNSFKYIFDGIRVNPSE